MKRGKTAPASADIKEVIDSKSVFIVNKGFAMSDNAAAAVLRWLAGRR